MRQRSILKMILLSIITFGIYSLYWSISTKNEMNRLGANVPTAWLLIIPFVSIYWLWKYSEAVEHITGNKVSTPLAFVVEALLGFIGDIIIQSEFNKLAAAPAAGGPGAGSPAYAGPPQGGPQPDNSFGGPVSAPSAGAPAPAPFTPAGPPAAPEAPVPSAEQPSSFAPAPPQPPIAPTPNVDGINPPTPPQPPQTPPQVQ